MFPTDIQFSHAHSHYSSYNARRSCILVVSHPVPVAERRDNKGVLKKQLKDQREKLDDLDTRLSRVEAIQERQEGYRRLRVEQCAGLDTLWNMWKVRFRLQSSGPGRQVFWNTMCSGGT